MSHEASTAAAATVATARPRRGHRRPRVALCFIVACIGVPIYKFTLCSVSFSMSFVRHPRTGGQGARPAMVLPTRIAAQVSPPCCRSSLQRLEQTSAAGWSELLQPLERASAAGGRKLRQQAGAKCGSRRLSAPVRGRPLCAIGPLRGPDREGGASVSGGSLRSPPAKHGSTPSGPPVRRGSCLRQCATVI